MNTYFLKKTPRRGINQIHTLHGWNCPSSTFNDKTFLCEGCKDRVFLASPSHASSPAQRRVWLLLISFFPPPLFPKLGPVFGRPVLLRFMMKNWGGEGQWVGQVRNFLDWELRGSVETVGFDSGTQVAFFSGSFICYFFFKLYWGITYLIHIVNSTYLMRTIWYILLYVATHEIIITIKIINL